MIAAALLLTLLQPQPAPPVPADSGQLVLFKLQQRAGVEQYRRERRAGEDVLHVESGMSYLGGEVPLRATYVSAAGRPRSLAVRGATSTRTSIDAEVAIDGAAARVRDRAGERTVPAAGAFPLTHYPPFALVEALYGFWRAEGRPDSVPLLPYGAARFERRGTDTLAAPDGGAVAHRYSVDGVVWGRMSAWFDPAGRLLAAVAGDAEMDRTQAVRAGFEAALPLFVARSVADGVDDQARIAATLPPRLEGAYAVTGVRIVDGTGAAAVEDGVLVVAGGRISAIGPRSAVAVPGGIPVWDAGGLTALPGLWDMHGHYEQVEWPLADLAAGITTVRDAGNEIELIVALRDAARAGRILSPRLLAAGVVDGGDAPLGVITAASAEEARAAVRRYGDLGFEQIKIYGGLPPELVPVVADEAHRRGMTVTGHVPRGMDAEAFVRAGADQINHLVFLAVMLREPGQPPRDFALDSEEARAVLRFFAGRGTVMDATMARTEQARHPRGRYGEVEPGLAHVPRELREAISSTGAAPEVAERARAVQQRLMDVFLATHRAGIPVVLGSDLTVPGYTMYRELELAVAAGLTPMEAIQAATLVPARVMGMDAESGTLEAGKRADVVLVDGDPLADVSAIRNVRWVVTAGSLYDATVLRRAAGFGAEGAAQP